MSLCITIYIDANIQESKIKDNSIQPFDNDSFEEIEKIKEMLNPYENVLLVARQSRIL